MDKSVTDILFNDQKCFVCGLPEEGEKLTSEHVIPRWVLKDGGLFDVPVNEIDNICYGRLTLPCCSPCNSRMGRIFEAPLSQFLRKSRKKQIELLKTRPQIERVLYKWFAFLVLKTEIAKTRARCEDPSPEMAKFLSRLHAISTSTRKNPLEENSLVLTPINPETEGVEIEIDCQSHRAAIAVHKSALVADFSEFAGFLEVFRQMADSGGQKNWKKIKRMFRRHNS